MTAIVRIFDFQGFEVRFVGTPESPAWIAQDVCAVLDIAEARSSMRDFEEYQKGVYSMHTLGGNQDMLTVTEPGLYALIFRSRKPQAKEFQRWVFETVLPSIRKTGQYSPASQSPLGAFQAAIAPLLEQEKQIAAQHDELSAQQEQINQLKLQMISLLQPPLIALKFAELPEDWQKIAEIAVKRSGKIDLYRLAETRHFRAKGMGSKALRQLLMELEEAKLGSFDPDGKTFNYAL